MASLLNIDSYWTRSYPLIERHSTPVQRHFKVLRPASTPPPATVRAQPAAAQERSRSAAARRPASAGYVRRRGRGCFRDGKLPDRPGIVQKDGFDPQLTKSSFELFTHMPRFRHRVMSRARKNAPPSSAAPTARTQRRARPKSAASTPARSQSQPRWIPNSHRSARDAVSADRVHAYTNAQAPFLDERNNDAIADTRRAATAVAMHGVRFSEPGNSYHVRQAIYGTDNFLNAAPRPKNTNVEGTSYFRSNASSSSVRSSFAALRSVSRKYRPQQRGQLRHRQMGSPPRLSTYTGL